MPGSYKQLDFAERQQVYFLRKQGLSCRGIARQLGRSPSTISREFRRNARGSKYSGRGHIPGRVDISERPGAAQEKGRVGDWEADTIVGAGHKGGLVSIVDRSSKFAILQLVGGKEFGGSGLPTFHQALNLYI